MKVILIFLCGLIFVFNAFGQTEPQQRPIGGVEVETIWLARDNGSGKPGEETDFFYTRDIPIYCVVHLDSLMPAIVKMNLVVVKVAGVKTGTKVFTVSYKTNGTQNRVNFTGKPDTLWMAGTYRIDIFVDGKTGGSREFAIQKSPLDIEKEKAQKQTPVKPVQKSKTARRFRKN